MAEIIPHQIDDKLIELLNKEFQDADFKSDFITNFQLYLIYGNDPTKFVVDLDNIWEWIGFNSKGNAKRTLVKYFQENTDYKTENSLFLQDKRVHGGQNKETILMNVDTFKAFCMISNTDKGKQTRRYYSKMETVFFRYLQEKHRTTIQELEEQKKALEYDNKKQKALEIQKKLLSAHKNTPLVYILKIQEDDDNNFIIKIGETDDIEQRIISLRQEYKDSVLIDAFPCQRPHGFEQYILHRKDVLKHKFVSTETIKISKDFPYSNLLKIINKNIHNFDGLTPTQKLDMALSKERALLMQLIQSADNPEQKQQFVDMLTKLDCRNIPITTKKEIIDDDEDTEFQDRHRRVYKYQLNDLKTPIETFYSLKEAARSLDSPNVHDYHIRNASNSNTEFFGFRWYYVDGSTDIPEDIPPTVEKEKKVGHRKGLVAQISSDRKTMLNVYPSQKLAAEAHKIPLSSITNGITTRKKTHGFYWDMYDNCDEELKISFTGVLPEASRVATCSKIVQRIDPDTDEILEVYPCIQDVCSTYRTCHKTINKVSEYGEIYKGYKWNITCEIKSE